MVIQLSTLTYMRNPVAQVPHSPPKNSYCFQLWDTAKGSKCYSYIHGHLIHCHLSGDQNIKQICSQENQTHTARSWGLWRRERNRGNIANFGLFLVYSYPIHVISLKSHPTAKYLHFYLNKVCSTIYTHFYFIVAFISLEIGSLYYLFTENCSD